MKLGVSRPQSGTEGQGESWRGSGIQSPLKALGAAVCSQSRMTLPPAFGISVAVRPVAPGCTHLDTGRGQQMTLLDLGTSEPHFKMYLSLREFRFLL